MADLLDLVIWTLELVAGPNQMLVEWVLWWAAEVRVLVEALEYLSVPGRQVVLEQSQMRPGWPVPYIPTCEPAIIPQKRRILNKKNKLYSMCTQGGAPKRFFGVFSKCAVSICRKWLEYNFYSISYILAILFVYFIKYLKK